MRTRIIAGAWAGAAALAWSAVAAAQEAPAPIWRLVAPVEAEGRDADATAVPVHGWLRLDTDAHALGLYVGGSYRLGEGWAFAPFAHARGALVEPNVAFTFQRGGFWIMPAVGTTLDFATNDVVSVDPQLFVAADLGLVELEGWAQYFAAAALHANATDEAQLRGMALGVFSRYVAAGVEGDATLATKNAPPSHAWLSAPVGARTNLRLGDHDTVALFVGYETVSTNRGSGDGVAGRLEFVHRW